MNVTTWRYIPEDSKLHTHCHEPEISHIKLLFLFASQYILKHLKKNRHHELFAELAQVSIYHHQSGAYTE
jgi:hypothetical protein